MNQKHHRLQALDDLQNVLSRIPQQWILAFFSACVFFAIFHAGYFDDRMVNEDYQHFATANWQRISLGRFLCFYLITSYCNSWTIGCEACLYFALSTVMIVSMFHIRTKIGAIMTAVLVVGMPSLAYMFSFLASAPLYGRMYFLAILSVWIADRWRWGFIPASIVLTISLGVGQAGLIAAAVLCLLILWRDIILDEGFQYKTLFKKTLRLLIMGIIGVILYLLLWKMICKVMGIEMSDYRGMSQIGQFSLQQFGNSFLRSYIDFFKFFLTNRFFFVSPVQKVAYIILFIVTGFAVVYSTLLKPYRTPGIIVALLLLPPCIGVIDIFVPQITTDSLMIYPIVFSGVFTLRLAEDSLPANRFGMGAFGLLFCSLCITCLSYWSITSAFYVKAETYNEQTAAYENRLLSRIEETPGYYPGIPVAIISNNTNESYRGLASNDFPDVLNDRDMWYSYVGSYTNSMKKTIRLIKEYTGVALKSATAAQTEQIRYSPELREMSAYPLEGSTRVVNGILAVNTIYRDVEVMQVDDSTVFVNYISYTPVSNDATYAWYVMKNGERIPELGRDYSKESGHWVELIEDGTYTFKGFCNQGGIKAIANSFSVVVKNGVIVEDEKLERVSMEEALDSILPPLQIVASQNDDRAISLDVPNCSIYTDFGYSYAWRIYRNGEHLEEFDRGFSSKVQYDVTLQEDGQYRFELIYKKENESAEKSVLSEETSIYHELEVLRAGDNTILLQYVGPLAEEIDLSFAWYGYKDGERIPELGRDYQYSSAYIVTLDEDATYVFRCFVKVAGENHHSITCFPIVVDSGVIKDDPRLRDISIDDALKQTQPELEVNVVILGVRGVKLTVIENSLHTGPEYTYAWYVYRNGERLTEYDRGYYPDPEYDLILAEDGEYQFKLFYRIGDVRKSVMSAKVLIGETQSEENAA